MQLRYCIDTIKNFYTYQPPAKERRGEPLFFNINRNPFSRYLYLFLKFFHMEGYAVHLPKSPRLIYHLVSDHYASLLLKERIVVFGKPLKEKQLIEFPPSMISPDYFDQLDNRQKSAHAYYIPMSQHPLMYHAGFWDQPISEGRRKRSVFMAGNFDPRTYRDIENDGMFRLLSRLAVQKQLNEKGFLFPINNEPSLSQFLSGNDDNKVILVNRLEYDVPMQELRSMLAKFDFFFALPGVVMPLCHNIVEAMSSGCIPFLQESYANLFDPPLRDGVCSITFRDEKDLPAKLKMLFDLPDEKVNSMRAAINNYYRGYLTPASVVRTILSGHYSRLYLQAEHLSVALLRKRFTLSSLARPG
jgi:hypothetical protein